MALNSERLRLFDAWSKDYDRIVPGSNNFPFLGYEEVLSRLIVLADFKTHHRVLELGVGTGNLTCQVLVPPDQIWGLDFSRNMLTQAKLKLPRVHLFQADLSTAVLPLDPLHGFDRIISSYVFHEFRDEVKIRILKQLTRRWLLAVGKWILADIIFADLPAFDQAQKEYASSWDPDEYYWCAEDIIPQLSSLGFEITYEQMNPCAGIFVIRCD